MNGTEVFAYDAVPYPGRAFTQTHPDRLATTATLFGMTPALPSRCRVLELGCGLGANLCPMAYQYPESEFVGIDLSAPTIAQGQAQAAAYGLTNVSLHACDIMQVDASFGQFDYIIAYGVYSWVPPAVRAKIMAIFRERLALQGVALVSFNAYPGSHLRDLGRSIMLHHVRAIPDPHARVQQARAVLRAVAAASDANQVYGAALRETARIADQKIDEVLYHDDLNADATAFLFQDVVEAAQREGLQYLSEASVSRSVFGSVPQFVVECFDAIAEEEIVAREQYLDLLVGRWFREALLCHADVALNRPIDPQIVKSLWVSGDLQLLGDPAVHGQARVEFKTREGDTIGVEHPITKAALFHLGRIWPGAAAFSTLAETATRMLGMRPEADELGTLAEALCLAHRGGVLDLHVEASAVASAGGDRPKASLIARRQAETGPVVTNLRHTSVVLDDISRHFIQLVDGTRDMAQLAAALVDLSQDRRAGVVAEASGTPEERAERAVVGLAKLALLLK